MAAHAHTQIRTALVAALTGLATTGTNVFPNRLHPLADADLPALRIFADRDEVESLSIHAPVTQGHALAVIVECAAKANSALEDTLDQIQQEVEIALSAGLTVDSQWLQPLLTGSQYSDEIGATNAAVKQLQFVIAYHTLNNAPDALI